MREAERSDLQAARSCPVERPVAGLDVIPPGLDVIPPTECAYLVLEPRVDHRSDGRRSSVDRWRRSDGALAGPQIPARQLGAAGFQV